jgi:hypothetical protein
MVSQYGAVQRTRMQVAARDRPTGGTGPPWEKEKDL